MLKGYTNYVVVVQSPRHVRLFATPRTAALQASLSLTISQSLAKFISIASMMPSSHLILCCPLLFLRSIFPSIRDFSSKSAVCIPGDQNTGASASASVLPLIFLPEYLGLISLKMYWFYLLAVLGTLRSLLQHHSLKALIPWCSAFFTVQLSKPYMTTRKTIALTILNFVGKVMSLTFNTLSTGLS